ncbi:MAG TPA: hypothetical protein PLK94_01605 [Alphaproteobacteria bacterium]|nr:hypothetical protein [Alphaproteobacteria bacterium]
MATPSTPTLGGTNLPMPSEVILKVGRRIVQRRLADGSLDEVVVQASTKRVFTLKWVKLSETERDTIVTKFVGILGGTTATFVDVEGDSYTVSNDEGQDEIEFEYYVSSGVIYYKGSLRLRET